MKAHINQVDDYEARKIFVFGKWLQIFIKFVLEI